ncbi:MAG TPA: orotidine-5'-phosphate decarboxylase [Alphaproteobacteria bacterium]|jgi:orotidine-5'-phosphate decarboxylase
MNAYAAKPLIFCAVDTPDIERAKNLAGVLARTGCGLKLGLEFFSTNGPQGVRAVTGAYPDLPLFLDLKFHDIPNTVAQAVRSAVQLRPAHLNVHAAGGAAMMKAAYDAAGDEAARHGMEAPRLLAVTVLTSMDEAALDETGQAGPAAVQVERLALLTKNGAGLDGVVCSAHEIETLRRACGPDFILMVPGIRPAGSATQDQKRTMTPAQAVKAGATHLVIGRPITGAADPEAAIHAILSETL